MHLFPNISSGSRRVGSPNHAQTMPFAAKYVIFNKFKLLCYYEIIRASKADELFDTYCALF